MPITVIRVRSKTCKRKFVVWLRNSFAPQCSSFIIIFALFPVSLPPILYSESFSFWFFSHFGTSIVVLTPSGRHESVKKLVACNASKIRCKEWKAKKWKWKDLYCFRVQFGALWHTALKCVLLKAKAHSAKKRYYSVLGELGNLTQTQQMYSTRKERLIRLCRCSAGPIISMIIMNRWNECCLNNISKSRTAVKVCFNINFILRTTQCQSALHLGRINTNSGQCLTISMSHGIQCYLLPTPDTSN